MIAKVFSPVEEPVVLHEELETTFTGVVHSISTPDAPVHQYRGIRYASIPARFRQSHLVTAYPAHVDATRYGPICPQTKRPTVEELIALPEDAIPEQHLKQSEADCLNLNITCPASATPDSRLPVMLWIHGGESSGSGSHWIFDGGSLVQKSLLVGKPVIVVTCNYRLGLLGFAASPALREDNKAAGDEGVGNYGLRDQRRALEWVYCFISAFGGNPQNITLFGASEGAADILCHLHSAANETQPLFRRAILQSTQADLDIPHVHAAGAALSKIMCNLRVPTIEELRHVPPEKLAALGTPVRAVNDGVFFRKGFTGRLTETLHGESFVDTEHGHALKAAQRLFSFTPVHARTDKCARSRSRPRHVLQPIMIGDCGDESTMWALPAAMWTASAVVRRVRAVCQSMSKASAVLRAYDIDAYTPGGELPQRVLELINDVRFAWPAECIANAHKRAGGRGVWRYVFDQDGPSRLAPHHAVDLMYLFDNAPLPSALPSASAASTSSLREALQCPPDRFDVDDDSDDDSGYGSAPFDNSAFDCAGSSESGSTRGFEDCWMHPVVDDWTYARVRDAVQERWIAFAQGEAPWQEDKLYVFGPEGEVGERSLALLQNRRRVRAWKEALEPLGPQLVQKLGVELCKGPGDVKM